MRSGANTYSHAGSVMNEKLFGAIYDKSKKWK
jgi:hypothetical protein